MADHVFAQLANPSLQSKALQWAASKLQEGHTVHCRSTSSCASLHGVVELENTWTAAHCIRFLHVTLSSWYVQGASQPKSDAGAKAILATLVDELVLTVGKFDDELDVAVQPRC